MAKNVVIIGGGIAGLAASIVLARGGRTVTLFEKRRALGGRAVTHLRHGYRFNLGPHAFYRGGLGAEVLRELGIPVRGGVPNGQGIALYGGERFKFPGTTWSLLTTALLPAADKIEMSKLLLRVRRLKRDSQYAAGISAQKWLDENVRRTRARQTLEAALRLATYCVDLDKLRAGTALRHFAVAMRGVIYIDEGWQKIVDALHTSAVTAGVNFVTSSRVVSVIHDGQSVRGIEIGGLEADAQDTAAMLRRNGASAEPGTRLDAETVLLAVDPPAARELVPDLRWPELVPVVVSSLDVGLSRLPQPKNLFALGIDRPLYYSVHSQWAQLTPKGGALIHVARYGGGDQAELEALLDDMQPGWRDAVVHCRFLPSMVVSNALMPPAPARRPDALTPIRGLYLAGDWIGDSGLLSDASLASARAAARAILAS